MDGGTAAARLLLFAVLAALGENHVQQAAGQGFGLALPTSTRPWGVPLVNIEKKTVPCVPLPSYVLREFPGLPP